MSRMFGVKDVHVIAKLTAQDKALFMQIPDLLASVNDVHGDAAYGVLNRSAYREDKHASAEFVKLVESDLARDRSHDLAVLTKLTSEKPVLTPDEGRSVLRAINAARLTLAARAGAFDEGAAWESRVSEDPALAAVAWLSHVESDLIAALNQLDPIG